MRMCIAPYAARNAAFEPAALRHMCTWRQERAADADVAMDSSVPARNLHATHVVGSLVDASLQAW